MATTCKSLFNEALQKYSKKEIASRLNLSVGTVSRWIDTDNYPPNYIFDLHRILSKNISYENYTIQEKDQFFTPIETCQKCWNTATQILKDIDDYQFIEPSAGEGNFLSVLPDNTIAFDIEPKHDNIIKQDFLTWQPTTQNKYIVFGNPPFGLRGHVALQFINHSYSFADYVCFILPQLFESDGKGSPRKRIRGYNLIHSEKCHNLFHYPDKKQVKVNVVFQIWSKVIDNVKYHIQPRIQDIVKVYSLSDGGTVSTTRNKKMLDKCDIYLPSTCFGENAMTVYYSFRELPNQKGYGIVFLKHKKRLLEASKSIDWKSVGFLSTNSSINLRTSLIIDEFNRFL